MPTTRFPASVRVPFGLVAQLESSRIVLPLKGVKCEFQIFGGIAEVSMSQIFRQENAQALDCNYLFPLPADAAVYFCEADINGRVIRAQVKEREEALRLAAEHKQKRERVLLVESERDNLFTLTLNNLQPFDLVLVTLKYIQPVSQFADESSLHIPFCPGIRYIPGNPLLRSNRGNGIVGDTDQVPDASRISPPRISPDHPDAAYVEVSGTIDDLWAEDASIQSPSHDIEFSREEGALCVRLRDNGDVPDRNFVLRWRTGCPDETVCRAQLTRHEGHQYALLELKAPRPAMPLETHLDFYFLLDHSGSMQGLKWHKAVAALQSCLQILGPADRAMLTLFSNGTRDFAEKPQSPGELLGDKNLSELANLSPGGGTQMLPALQHIVSLSHQHSSGRAKNLILITDAQVGNEDSILQTMAKETNFPVHCFGIDVALNDALLIALTRQQGGTFHSLHPNDDIEAKVRGLTQTIRLPVLTELKLPEGWEIGETMMPNLYAGKTVYVSARSSAEKELSLIAKTPAGASTVLPVKSRNGAGTVPFLQWSRARIQHHLAHSEHARATELSIASNLICPTTAFIAWDEAEKVVVATQGVPQPSMLQEIVERLHSESVAKGICLDMPHTMGRAMFKKSTAPRPVDQPAQRFMSGLLQIQAWCSRPDSINHEECLGIPQKYLASSRKLAPSDLQPFLEQLSKQIESAKQQAAEALKRWKTFALPRAIPSALRNRTIAVREAHPFLKIWDDLAAYLKALPLEDARELLKLVLEIKDTADAIKRTLLEIDSRLKPS